MEKSNIIFLEIIEWFDETGREIVHRIPEKGSGDIKYGAQMIVRESQSAVFFYNGKAYDAFGAGRHTLKTANFPILTRVLSAPWGMTSPLRAEVYFVNMKVFPNLKWGTKDPVAFRDKELGLIRLRAFGVFNIQVLQPVLLINTLVGTQGIYTTEALEDYLSQVIVSRINDLLGGKLDTIFDLPGRYEELAGELMKTLGDDFRRFGLGLSNLYINSITPPLDVQKAIDDKSRLNAFDDLNRLLQMKAAMALEKASESQGEAGAAMGMGRFNDACNVGQPLQRATATPRQKETGVPSASTLCPNKRSFVPTVALICSFLTNVPSATRTFRPQPNSAQGAGSRLRPKPLRRNVLTAGLRTSQSPSTAMAAAKNLDDFINPRQKNLAALQPDDDR
jgi:membrane protease subunit (stomatin/prohibitin family)